MNESAASPDRPDRIDPWEFRPSDGALVGRLASELALAPPTALVLVARGRSDPDSAHRFLTPRLGELRPPDAMAGFGRAIDRLTRALRDRETIGIFGDYDVDGVTSAALLTSYLRRLGAEVRVRVARRNEGYGFSVDRVRELEAQGCTLLIACDCGTSDHEAARFAAERSIDLLVVDHHQVPTEPSCASALLNPHQPDCKFPFKGLASVGVAFYLVAALRSRLRCEGGEPPPDPREWLDLVALGTLADLAPLVEENRVLVSVGLRLLAERRRPGIRALLASVGIGHAPTAFDVGYKIAPRLNAPGRMGDAAAALELLLAEDEVSARQYVTACEEANQRRQQIQETVLEEAIRQVEADGPDRVAIVCAREGWHEGVLGIVAARLCDRYKRPAVVLGGDGTYYRGSVRSAGRLHAQRALLACAGLLERFGGHEAAAGLTVQASRLASFREAWETAARHAASDGRPPLRLQIDGAVGLDQIDEAAARDLARLGPFGIGNPEPLFVAQAFTERTRVVGRDHLQLTLRTAGTRHRAIAFRLAERDPGDNVSVRVAFVPEIDVYQGQERLQIRVQDFISAPS